MAKGKRLSIIVVDGRYSGVVGGLAWDEYSIRYLRSIVRCSFTLEDNTIARIAFSCFCGSRDNNSTPGKHLGIQKTQVDEPMNMI